MADPMRSLSWRRSRLRAARLYFVCEARPRDSDPRPLLDAALRGGADIVQLRDKELGDDEIVAAAAPFREGAGEHGSLFILNDRPDLVEACGADGVHVGQEDVSVAEARRIAGSGVLVGLSTHTHEQVDAAVAAQGDYRADQMSVGPVWETPTKAGRPAAGLELVRYAAQHVAGTPWFAIGGIDTTNVGEVLAAGAERVVVVRAIRDAADPEAATRELRAALDSPSQRSFEELAKAVYGAINRRDLEGFLAFVHPEVEFRSLVAEAEAQIYRGHAGVREWWEQVSAAFGGFRFDLQDLRAFGDRGYIRLVVRGTVAEVEIPQLMWQSIRLQDGRAIWWQTFRTEAEAREALGLPASEAPDA